MISRSLGPVKIHTNRPTPIGSRILFGCPVPFLVSFRDGAVQCISVSFPDTRFLDVTMHLKARVWRLHRHHFLLCERVLVGVVRRRLRRSALSKHRLAAEWHLGQVWLRLCDVVDLLDCVLGWCKRFCKSVAVDLDDCDGLGRVCELRKVLKQQQRQHTHRACHRKSSLDCWLVFQSVLSCNHGSNSIFCDILIWSTMVTHTHARTRTHAHTRARAQGHI